ncbi:MAG TPA: MerP protein [Bacteroidales bacterium]|nr:MAG: hypothetical protein A2W98_07740 [Bacteroidetes bacterium GWF2_33_38]OFY68265.1 MAG: hypothetical protein A2265_07470 [Bacteroidetes bacterium RIFOXYA12_FULL_33_9]OFY89544.1 MAG: hypothetical protein A2236_02410 [Bacteroidetes bacterium RIFOXYA2_FULL_33_7]HBF87292.1 MerP protein [Bacteroidales bacterium]
MKRIKIIVVLVSIFIGIKVSAQKNLAEVSIQTSAQCGMCKDRIEKNMVFEKGVVDALLYMDTKIVVIKYKTNKTNIDNLRNGIAKLGYDADNIPADPKAYEKLPPCCKKPDDPNHVGH